MNGSIEHYNIGDELFIFGFSRCAYTARSLSGFISKCGLLAAGAPLSVDGFTPDIGAQAPSGPFVTSWSNRKKENLSFRSKSVGY